LGKFRPAAPALAAGFSPQKMTLRFLVRTSESYPIAPSMEESTDTLERVAAQCGFGSGNSMRRSFLRVVKVPPADY
jgi:transcriptional regulator GlxA family with amidase domain